MILASVSYQRPASLAEAVQVLADHPGARVLAGGQSLVNILKLRAAHVDLLVDITRLEELRGITVGEDGTARIGAGVTYDELAHSEALRESHPIICEVAANTVDQQVRNRGTIGGNVCHADPINNFPPLVVALGATMHLVGPGGERTVPAEEFFTGFYTTAVEPGEILTAITVPPLPAGTGVGYVDIEIGEAAARAVAVVRSEDDRIADAVVVVGCLPAPARRPAVEAALRGGATDAATIAAATADAAAGLEPVSDADASAEYRKAMIPVVTKRAVSQAIGEGGR